MSAWMVGRFERMGVASAIDVCSTLVVDLIAQQFRLFPAVVALCSICGDRKAATRGEGAER